MIHDFDCFIGERVTVAPNSLDLDAMGLYDLDCYYDPAEDESGDGRLIIEDHDPADDDLEDEEDEPDEEDPDDESDEDEDEEDDDYGYSYGYTILMGLDFEIEDHCLSSIEPFAEPVGDDGLGDCDPEDEWSVADYDKATAFLKAITAVKEN